MPFLSPVDETSYVSAGCESSLPREINDVRWIVRDVGIFLYGCLFASKYIFFFQRVAGQPDQHDAKKPLFQSVPLLRLKAVKILRSAR
jgi:hypothetical protein